MTRRGMTILEVLLSLVLLGALASMLTSWLVTISRASAEHGSRMQWRSAARGALDLIEDDLTTGDFEIGAQGHLAQPQVVVVEPSRLRIRTRSTWTHSPQAPGPAIHEYLFDPMAGVLMLSISSNSSAMSPWRRSLVTSVTAWEVDSNEEQRILSIRIESSSGEAMSRRFSWP